MAVVSNGRVVRQDICGTMDVRGFLNTDVPEIVALWNQQAPRPGRFAPLTPEIFETHVLSKMYFRPDDLLLAVEGTRICGLAHGGYLPTADQAGLDFQRGVICVVLVAGGSPPDLFHQLLNAVQASLVRGGARELRFASGFPFSPFYKGLLGGTFVPGVDTEDTRQLAQLEAFGFRLEQLIDVFGLSTTEYRAPVDRRMILANRQYEIRVATDPPPASWWQANQEAFRHFLEFRLVDRKTHRECGRAVFLNTTPTETGWDSTQFGLRGIQIDEALRHQGLGKTLLVDAIRDLTRRGILQIEAQVPRANVVFSELLRKVGFQFHYSAVQLYKTLDESSST